MESLKETEQTNHQQKRKNGTLKDYTLQHRVAIKWDLNEDAEREQMFKLTIDDYEVILDAEEFMRYLRWV
jgi:hypothetical protein